MASPAVCGSSIFCLLNDWVDDHWLLQIGPRSPWPGINFIDPVICQICVKSSDYCHLSQDVGSRNWIKNSVCIRGSPQRSWHICCSIRIKSFVQTRFDLELGGMSPILTGLYHYCRLVQLKGRSASRGQSAICSPFRIISLLQTYFQVGLGGNGCPFNRIISYFADWFNPNVLVFPEVKVNCSPFTIKHCLQTWFPLRLVRNGCPWQD